MISFLHQRTASPKVFTIGYEGVSVEIFIRELQDKGVFRVIDVRCNAISRKKGFSKTSLKTMLREAGIDYVHLPELGIPSSLRSSLHANKDYDALFAYYEKNILPNAVKKIDEAIDLLQEKPSVLLCFESDPHCCHRTRLAHYISRKTNMPEIPLTIRQQ